jgi:ribose transport system substrate-binding protein
VLPSPEWGRVARLVAGVVAILAAAVVAVGCGDSDDESSGSGTSTSSGSSSELAPAQASIDQYKKPPVYKDPGPPIDVSSLKGQTIAGVPSSSGIPFVAGVLDGEAAAAQAAGLKYNLCPTQGQLTEWQKCITQGIGAKVNMLSLFIPDAKLVEPQLQQAKSANIPANQNGADNLGKVPNGISATVDQDLALVGKLLADYSIVYRKGKVNAVIVETTEITGTDTLVNAIEDEFKKVCPDTCKATTIDVPIADWATKIQTGVQSAINSDPTLNMAIPIYDGMASFTVTGINAAAAADKVKIATFNGTPAVLSQIGKEGSPVVMDIGQPVGWIGWNDIDQELRVLLEEDPVDHVNPVRIFDESNISELGAKPNATSGYPDSYVAGYRKLWGLD